MTHSELKNYEAMAKLCLPDDEAAWALEKINMMTDSFKKLEEIDTDGVEPLVSVLDMTNVMREDESTKMLPREEILRQAPMQYDGYFQVPKTIE